jgi:hypothetical protein
VGLQRETAGVEREIHVLAEVRTYSLVSLYGFGCGWLFRINLGLALPAGMPAHSASFKKPLHFAKYFAIVSQSLQNRHRSGRWYWVLSKRHG